MGEVITRPDISELAVMVMKAYGKFIIDHAETMVGDIGPEEWVAEDGLRVSFTVSIDPYKTPVVSVVHERLAIEVADVLDERSL